MAPAVEEDLEMGDKSPKAKQKGAKQKDATEKKDAAKAKDKQAKSATFVPKKK